MGVFAHGYSIRFCDVSSSFFITVDGNNTNTIDSVSTIDVDAGGAMDGTDIDVLQ